jgi:hypothetical protein
MRVRWKQSTASSDVQTMGSFSLKFVFRITWIPIFRWNAPEKAGWSTPACDRQHSLPWPQRRIVEF